MPRRIAAFEWDHGNSAKCQKHGLTLAAIESCFARPILVLPDADHSQYEERLRAIGRDQNGRHVFIVFTVRRRAPIRHSSHQRALCAQQGDRKL